jgi:hypothetical protein
MLKHLQKYHKTLKNHCKHTQYSDKNTCNVCVKRMQHLEKHTCNNTSENIRNKPLQHTYTTIATYATSRST